jgi:hypothetical protein
MLLTLLIKVSTGQPSDRHQGSPPFIRRRFVSLERRGSMGAYLLHDPWVQLYLLYFGAIVVVNFLGATTPAQAAGKSRPVRCQNESGKIEE